MTATAPFHDVAIVVVVRAVKYFGGILAWKTMSRRSLNDPFLATSATMETYGAYCCFLFLLSVGYGIMSHAMVLDGDVNLAAMFARAWPVVTTASVVAIGRILCCCGK